MIDCERLLQCVSPVPGRRMFLDCIDRICDKIKLNKPNLSRTRNSVAVLNVSVVQILGDQASNYKDSAVLED